MGGAPTVDELAAQADEAAEELDYRALCRSLGADDVAEKTAAEDVRQTVICEIENPEPVVDELWTLIVDDEDRVRREATDTLRRMLYIWPRRFTDRLEEGLESDDVRRRGAAAYLIGALPPGEIRSVRDGLVGLLDDSDARVAAVSLATLDEMAVTFPEEIVGNLASIREFMRGRWRPRDDSEIHLSYSKLDHHPDVDAGEPERPRLTHEVVRPFETALSLLASVALHHPAEVEPFVPTLAEIVDDEGAPGSDLFDVIERVTRSNPSLAEHFQPAMQRLNDVEEQGWRRAKARNLLRLWGREIESNNVVEIPREMATRDHSPDPELRNAATSLDIKAIEGDMDMEQLLPLMRSDDADLRELIFFDLRSGIGFGGVKEMTQSRAPDFLALLNEPDKDAREHLIDLLDPVVATEPDSWTPSLLALTEDDDPLVRDGATRLLAAVARTAPSLLNREFEHVERALEDRRTQEAGFVALQQLAEPFPERAADAVSRSDEVIAPENPSLSALRFLDEMATVRPNCVTGVTDEVVELVQGLAGQSAISDRAKYGRTGEARDVGRRDRALKPAFGIAGELCRVDPELVETLEAPASRIADGRYYGHKKAKRYLDLLEWARETC